MKLWLIVVRGDDSTWVEDAWDDNSTAENRAGWEERVDKARDMAHSSGYELRILAAEVEGIYEAFDSPTLEGKVEDG